MDVECGVSGDTEETTICYAGCTCGTPLHDERADVFTSIRCNQVGGGSLKEITCTKCCPASNLVVVFCAIEEESGELLLISAVGTAWRGPSDSFTGEGLDRRSL